MTKQELRQELATKLARGIEDAIEQAIKGVLTEQVMRELETTISAKNEPKVYDTLASIKEDMQYFDAQETWSIIERLWELADDNFETDLTGFVDANGKVIE